MHSKSLPLPLSMAALHLVPSVVLARVTEVVWLRMQTRHPKLFENLARLDPALIYLVPTDTPHSFALHIGKKPVEFYLLSQEEKADRPPHACVKGRLESLIDMVEGRVDGDALFFSRDIQVEGDTAVIVGLRNTLDREELELFPEILSLCGPFAKPSGIAIGFLDRMMQKVMSHSEALHAEWHSKRPSGS